MQQKRASNGRFAKKNGKSTKAAKPSASPRAPNDGEPLIWHTATFSANLRAASGRMVYYNPDEALHGARQDAEAMLRDLSVKGPLSERLDSVALLKWHVEPEDKNDPAQTQMARDITGIIERIPNFLKYRRSLLWAVFHGRSAVSHTYGFDAYKDQTYLGIKSWFPMSGDKLVFDVDGRVGIRVGIVDPSLEPFRDKIEITREGRVLFLDDHLRSFYAVHQHTVEDAAFEEYRKAGAIFGLGIRNDIWWQWRLKNQVLSWFMNHLERFGSGLNIWYFTEGDPESFSTVKALAESQSHQTAIIMPRPMDKTQAGPGFEHVEVTGEGIRHMADTIKNNFEVAIRTYIVGQTLSSTTASTGLGSGVAELHAETKDAIIRGDAINLQETLTKELVNRLVAWNRPYFPNWPEDCDLKFMHEIDAPNVKESLEAAERLAGMGIPIDGDEVRSIAGLRKPSQLSPTEDNSLQFARDREARIERLAKSWTDYG